MDEGLKNVSVYLVIGQSYHIVFYRFFFYDVKKYKSPVVWRAAGWCGNRGVHVNSSHLNIILSDKGPGGWKLKLCRSMSDKIGIRPPWALGFVM